MKLNCINNGQPFTPQSTLGDLLEDLARRRGTRELGPEERAADDIELQLDRIVTVFQRTDPSVTREAIVGELKPWQLGPTYNALYAEPQEAADVV